MNPPLSSLRATAAPRGAAATSEPMAQPAGPPPESVPMPSSGLVSRAAARKQAHPTQGGLPPRQDLQRLADAKLRGYLLALAVDGRPATGPDLLRLRRAGFTREQTASLLPDGKGNVLPDVQRTGGESTRLVEAARVLADGLSQAKWPWSCAYGASALMAGAGNCGEQSAVGQMLHADRLKAGESLSLVTTEVISHAWTELRDGRGPKHAVVIDSWLRGPVVFAVDGQMSDQPRLVRTRLSLDGISGPVQRDALDGLLLESGAALAEEFQTARRGIPDTFRAAPESLYRPMSVVSRKFERRVQEKMAQPVDAARLQRSPETAWIATPQAMLRQRRLLNEVLAMGVVAELGPPAGIRERARQAKRTVAEASALRSVG
ncbi:hypothetical protein [Paracidovorax konjaci]|uniref:Uncharacterized protein n=1 Tax=Paracidovorax konjaci TaxID=32040 RepID=A0A1I1X6E1_9BURK|nr:hypothetical protein [Paracidovorax konjaci]SFE02939.1 hypothetical protein SAMN04489710_11215 [Paracidovorax konjaci]